MRKIIFFDINGTLIERDSRTDLPFSYAIDSLLGMENAMAGVDTAARSDQDVFMEVLRNHKVEYTDVLWTAFLDLYLAQLSIFEKSDVWRPNADCIEFLKFLEDKPYELGLVTGELSIGAAYKLKKIGLWQYFAGGGYGEDGLKRFEIAEAAVKKFNADPERDEIWIIGDTILDIETARHIGGKVVSIATGAHTKEVLSPYKPEYLIRRFSEIMDVFI